MEISVMQFKDISLLTIWRGYLGKKGRQAQCIHITHIEWDIKIKLIQEWEIYKWFYVLNKRNYLFCYLFLFLL